MTSPALSRRRFLAALAAGAGVVAFDACAPTAPSPPTPQPTAEGSPSPPVTATPAAGPTPTAGGARNLREKIASMLLVGFRGLDLSNAGWVRTGIGELGLGGVILFDRDGRKQGPRNVESPAQVAALTAEIRALAPQRQVIVAIDQEGGRVTRLSPKYGFPAVKSEAAIGEMGDAAVKAWADGVAATLVGAGINLNLAPVVDLNVNPDNPAIGALDRAFSADPAVVSRDAQLVVAAHHARGVRTALKHFPGLGSATANTDFGVADVTATWTEAELEPYRALIGPPGAKMIMAAHVVNGQIDPNAPASLSRATVTDLLRDQLGWTGVVVTDDMQAGAITAAFGADDAIFLAIDAGCDLLLFANQQVHEPRRAVAVIDLVERLIGEHRLTEARIDESVARIDALFQD